MNYKNLGSTVLVCALFALPSAGQNMEPTGALTLSNALELALRQSPELAVFEWDSRIAEARRLQASYRPNPELSLEIEGIRLWDGSDSNSTFGSEREVEEGGAPGFGDAEYTLSISQIIELGGKRMKRIRAAELEGTVFIREYEIARADVLAKVAVLFTDVLGAQERLIIAEQNLSLTQDVVRAISARVTAGQVSPIEEKRATVQVSQARIGVTRERLNLEAARILLAASWASEESVFSRVMGSLKAVPLTKTANELKSIVAQSPDLTYWISELSRLDSIVELERAQRKPDLGVRVAYRAQSLDSRSTRRYDTGLSPSFQGSGRSGFSDSREDTFILEFSLPLNFFNKNQGRIREAEYQIRKANANRRATELEIRTRIDSIFAGLQAAREEVRGLKEEVVPGAASAYEDTNTGYIAGKFRYLDVLDAQRTLIEVRGQYVDALVRFHQQRIILERLAGVDISASLMADSSISED